MPTLLQWWFLVGEVVALEMICTRDFSEHVRLKTRPAMTMELGLSDGEILALGCVATAIVVVLWPVFLVRSFFK